MAVCTRSLSLTFPVVSLDAWMWLADIFDTAAEGFTVLSSSRGHRASRISWRVVQVMETS